MSECEFYVERQGRGAGGAEYVRELCALTGRWCLMQAYYAVDTSRDRMKCERRHLALDYGAKHTTTRAT